MEIELISGFENAVLVDGEPDRVYEAEDINNRYEGLVSSYGIYSNIDGACRVIASSGLKVIVKSGKGEVNNHWFKIEADTELELETADVILDRIDSIIVRRTNNDRNIVLTVKKGELATAPVAPAIERTEEVQEICLANVYITKNATSLSASKITDTRANNNVCGYIACLVDQLNTTELFEQYEDAQNKFINEQTKEFGDWFVDIKDQVAATNLYREYQALYKNATVNEQEITIPTSINYVHNGLDVLNVHINGLRLIKDVDYTINATGTKITLTSPLNAISQDVLFINGKSVEGTIAESTITRVETLETKVADINNYEYEATGSADNIALGNKVVAFLDGTGDYSTVTDNASMYIKVNGVLGLDYSSDDALFNFQSSIASNRKVYVDFRNATIPYSKNISKTGYAIFYEGDNVTIIGANLRIDNITSTTLYGFHGGIIKECNITGTNNNMTTFYGAWGCKEVSSNVFNVTTNAANHSIYSCTRAMGNDYNGKMTSVTHNIANQAI